MTGKCKTGWRGAVLIGAGRMAQAHALALKQLGVPIAGVCDLRQEARDAIGDAFAVPATGRFVSSADIMAANPNTDLVVIATTADSHAQLVIEAAKAGARNILCEKPLAASVTDCDAMLTACKASGTKLAVNHQMRFMDQYLKVHEEVDSGRLGRLASMTVVGGCMGLAMNGSHYIEAFGFLTGARPVSATGFFTGAAFNNPRGPEYFDQAGEFRILGDSGQRLTIVIGADQGHGMTATYAGAFGHMFVDELEGEAIVTARKEEHRGQPPTRYGMPWERRTLRFPQADNVGPTREVLRALAAGSNYPDGEAGRRVIATLAACYASAESGGRPVAVDDPALAADRRFPWA